MVADAVERFLWETRIVVPQNLIHVLVMAKRHVDVLEAAVGRVNTILGAVINARCMETKKNAVGELYVSIHTHV